MGVRVCKSGAVHFRTSSAIFNKSMLVNWALASQIGGRTPIIPGRVTFQLQFIRMVSLVFWKLSLEGFYKCLG